ncbi:MAG: Cof-type HAD-IIB family hydrolase [Mollicutes bacterium PWAP]|nr:Cof-type HAD-IIB family hydrolase [Mollicutes bacterium PWAP]
MINSIKNANILFFDLDGTLFDKFGKNKISKKNINALNLLVKEGKKVVISTGRSYEKSINYIKDINFEFGSFQNGAVIAKKNGEILKESYIDEKVAKIIFNIIHNKKLEYFINGNNLVYNKKFRFISNVLVSFTNYKSTKEKISKFTKIKKIVIWNFFNKSFIKKLNKKLNKIKNISSVTSSGGKTIEITSSYSTKGLAIKYICQNIYKLKNYNAVHFGDSMNDSTTKEYATLIAMKNSSIELKKIAHFEGKKNKHAGIYKMLKKAK